MKSYARLINSIISLLIMMTSLAWSSERGHWQYLSSANGDIPILFNGKDLTSMALLDANMDGITEFVITDRASGPAVVLYLYDNKTWKPYVVESQATPIAAGTEAADIDGDGDPDIVAGGAWVNEVWWWENPWPDLNPDQPWTRRTIKCSGGKKHHDQLFGDFDGDGRLELVFWNQGDNALVMCEIPKDPHVDKEWSRNQIYTYSSDSEMPQRGRYPGFRGVHEHEGLDKADIDGDGKMDIVGGGRWFKHIQGTEFRENIIDASFVFTRAVAGDLIEGGRHEIILVPGDGWAPMLMYEWQEIKNQAGAWVPTEILSDADCVHSIRIVDFNGDGHQDIWFAEMRLNDGNEDARNQILLGDGQGGFHPLVISSGIELHESEIVDLDGDGDLDVIGKVYNWQSPRLDIWLNEGR